MILFEHEIEMTIGDAQDSLISEFNPELPQAQHFNSALWDARLSAISPRSLLVF